MTFGAVAPLEGVPVSLGERRMRAGELWPPGTTQERMGGNRPVLSVGGRPCKQKPLLGRAVGLRGPSGLQVS